MEFTSIASSADAWSPTAKAQIPTAPLRRVTYVSLRFAEATPGFLEAKWPGEGDRATNEFMERLRRNAKEVFGVDYSEARILELSPAESLASAQPL
ncbi:MAG: hypothetical protein DMG24_19020 [Acidobacteria bacterium]|nr:MAG: hypothetical protein DMG24_19020 [Acidobacteriota bacterium]